MTSNMPDPMKVAVRRLEFFRLHDKVILPSQGHPSDVGWDIHSFLITESGRETSRPCHQRGVTAIPTGLVVRPPSGFFVQVCSRSGLAQKGIFVANAPGIIDPSYTGEIVILLYNGSHETHYVSHGHRVAQLVLCPIVSAVCVEVKSRPTSAERGNAGFGSTGS